MNATQSKTDAVLKAREWISKGYLIGDTETTGLGDDAEIVEICLINVYGGIMLNTLIKPIRPIPAEAIAIHGITNEMVEYAPTWNDVHFALVELYVKYGFVFYNSNYDDRLIRQTVILNDPADEYFDLATMKSPCAMLAYSEYRGEPGKNNGYKWHKLVDAAAYEGVTVEGKAHRAFADCKMTLGIIRAMAFGGAETAGNSVIKNSF